MTPDAILTRLVELSRLIESHRSAIFLAEREQAELRGSLPASGWTPPNTDGEPR